LKENF